MSAGDPVFVLVHSPLVGPLTWRPVADILGRRGFDVLVPELEAPINVRRPYWLEYALEVAGAISAVPPGRRVVLAGHSNSGPRLPTYRQECPREVAAYVFVDAAMPERSLSSSALAYLERRRLDAVDGLVDPWSEEELAAAIPDPVMRRRFMAQLQRWPLSFFEEQVPVPPTWPDAPCGYLKFTDGYPESVARAQAGGWPLVEFAGAGHFHMLVDPPAVAGVLVDLVSLLV